MSTKVIEFYEGWNFMQQGIKKLLEGLPEPELTSEDFMMLYTKIYSMCQQKPPHDYSLQLYGKYRGTFEEYFSSTVLPSLREKHGEFLLRDFVKRWSNHKIMLKRMSGFFGYLERWCVRKRSLPSLNEVGHTCFKDLVYAEVNGKVQDAVISLIDQEHEGVQIDRVLLKNVVDVFIEIGSFENEFEAEMLRAAAAYYSGKASEWVSGGSRQDFVLKVEQCLELEKERASHYLHSWTKTKFVERVQHVLLIEYALLRHPRKRKRTSVAMHLQLTRRYHVEDLLFTP